MHEQPVRHVHQVRHEEPVRHVQQVGHEEQGCTSNRWGTSNN